MNLAKLPAIKRVVLISLGILVVINLLLLVYALIYADSESIYKRYAIVFCFSFIVVVRLTRYYYNTAANKH
jgi:hypothetical protein